MIDANTQSIVDSAYQQIPYSEWKKADEQLKKYLKFIVETIIAELPLSLCKSKDGCGCMTKTIDGKCGKCGAETQ